MKRETKVKCGMLIQAIALRSGASFEDIKDYLKELEDIIADEKEEE